ncbi:hypothetical protein OIU79_017841 [Salix purpurea]|uniref:Uncharacterized protein n=1 Tax=Salix purpurea TaxID=77065 RepID=A0A9Q1AKL1_SALPP|nr:hypothetical protein OIU79_017841 [Salix purpurea]
MRDTQNHQQTTTNLSNMFLYFSKLQDINKNIFTQELNKKELVVLL